MLEAIHNNHIIEQWLKLEPLDTLFFRGGEPMEAGETQDTGKPIFPPAPTTVIGALRTAILVQNGVDIEKVTKLKDDEDLDPDRLPFWGTPQKSGFRTVGPIFCVGNTALFPAPANWFYKPTKHKNGNKIRVFVALPKNDFPAKTGKRLLWCVKDPPAEDLDRMSGFFWVTKGALELKNERFVLDVEKDVNNIHSDKPCAIRIYDLVSFEDRVGIARDNISRAVRQGHLYATRHVRLKPGVSLIVGLDKPLCPSHIGSNGILQFGGEGRIVRYELMKDPPQLPMLRRGFWLALSPISWELASSCELINKAYISGKLFRVGGWDMRKGFHKPVETYFPIGAVFFANMDPRLPELIPF